MGIGQAVMLYSTDRLPMTNGLTLLAHIGPFVKT